MTKLHSTGMAIDGVFVSNDVAALGALKAVKNAELQIPRDIAIIGFSDWQFSSLVEPGLSSVSQPGYEIGKQAALLILEEINSKEKMKSQIKILDTEIIVRGSSKRK